MLTIRYLIWNLFWLLYIGAGTVCLFVDAVTSCAITRIQFQFHFCLPHPQFNYNFIWCVVVICSFAASLKFNIWNGERKKRQQQDSKNTRTNVRNDFCSSSLQFLHLNCRNQNALWSSVSTSYSVVVVVAAFLRWFISITCISTEKRLFSSSSFALF